MIKTKFVTLLSGTALIFVTACTDPGRFGNGQAGDNTKGGAALGAVIGAIAGSQASSRSDRTKGMIIGAAVGAGAGALIGQRLDQQEADLRRDLGNDQVSINNTGSELIVTLPQDILFAVDSAAVRSDLRRDLGTVASNLQAYPDTTIQVIGHTDNTGSASHNQTLSQRRAEAVAGILMQNGVPAGRIQSIGRGEDAPLATNLDAAGRAQNRRVEIIIRPNS